MKKYLIIIALSFSFVFIAKTQILCPSDVTQSCFSDIWPDVTGNAQITSPNFQNAMLKFEDDNDLNGCSTGVITRNWYLDVNYNDTQDDNEPVCQQLITLTYQNLPLNPQFPQDREYSCTDDIIEEHPSWDAHPCDMIAYTYEDQEFDFSGGACKKIVREYTIINWCTHNPDTGEGIFTGIQIIKIIDEEAPEFQVCADITIDALENCEAAVTLSNIAEEQGDCPSETLIYTLTVDLWGDGTDDLFFGPNESAPFRLNPVSNGDEIEVTFPENVGIGTHKVYWSVMDGCTNVRTCQYVVTIEDNKPPTPYCIDFTSATLDGTDGGQIVVPVSLFSLDAIDNCSSSENIELSFSENIDDKERILECGDTGFRFFRIYSTDEAGNQDFCEVFMLVLDNGTCFGKFEPTGSITTVDGSGVEGAKAKLMDNGQVIIEKIVDDSGLFSFGEQSLMDSYVAEVAYESNDMTNVDISDFLILQQSLLGLKPLTFYQSIAGDLDGNGKVSIDDLVRFKDYLTGEVPLISDENWVFVPEDLDQSSSESIIDMLDSKPITSYADGFHFIGIQKGDLSIDTPSAPEGKEVSIQIDVYNDKVRIYNTESIKVDAYEMQSVSTVQDVIEISYNHSLKSQELVLELDKANFDIDNLSSMLKIYLHDETSPATLSWNLNDFSDIPDTQEGKMVFPNPFTNRIMMMGDASEILLTDIRGEKLSYRIENTEEGIEISELDGLPSGIYLLSYTVNGEREVVKIVK